MSVPLAYAEEYNPCIGLSYENEVACVNAMRPKYSKGLIVDESKVESDNEKQATISAAIEAFFDKYNSLPTWKDKFEYIKKAKEKAKNAIAAGVWDGVPNEEYPIKPNANILDGNLDTANLSAELSGQIQPMITTCNMSSNTTYYEDTYVTGSCTWSGCWVKVYGKLFVQGTLTVTTTSTASAKITVDDGLQDATLQISGNLTLNAGHSGYNVQVYMGELSNITVTGTSSTNKGLYATTSSNSRVYFYGTSLYDWKGINVSMGARISLDGGNDPLNDPRVRIYCIGYGYKTIYYNGTRNANLYGLLFVSGTLFSSGDYGVYLYQSNSIYTETQQAFYGDIELKYNKLDEVYIPFLIKNITVTENIKITNNLISGFGRTSSAQNGIKLDHVRTLLSINLDYNTFSDYNDYSNWAIYVDNLMYGSGSAYKLTANNNKISGGKKGIYFYHFRVGYDLGNGEIGCGTEGSTNSEIKNNDIESLYYGIRMEYDENSEYFNDCDGGVIYNTGIIDHLVQDNKIIQSGTTASTTYGIYLDNLYETISDSQINRIVRNLSAAVPNADYYIKGFKYNVYIAEHAAKVTLRNLTLKFPDAIGSDNSIMIHVRMYNSGLPKVFIGGSSSLTNWFGSVSNHGSDAKQIYSTSPYANITCSYNHFESPKTVYNVSCTNDQ